MGCRTLYRKLNHIVVKSFYSGGSYFTVVNTKKRTHCHVHKFNYNCARMICVRASEGKIPDSYPEWMKDCIRRIL